MLQKIKNILFSFWAESGLPSYHKPQTYKILYKVNLKNENSIPYSGVLLFPIIPISEEQVIVDGPKISPGHTIHEDSVYHNKYALWPINLAPGEEKNIVQNVLIRTHAKKQVLLDVYQLAEYRDHPQHLSEETKHFQVSDPKIRDLVSTLIKTERRVIPLIKNFNDYVVDHLRYGNPIQGLYSATDAFKGNPIDCGGYNSLLITLCRAVGIPTRIVSGFWAGRLDVNELMHAWVEIMLPDKTWIPADPSVEQLFKTGRSRIFSKLGFVGSDRVRVSTGSDIPVVIENKEITLDILQNPYLYNKEGKAKLTFTFQAEKQ